MRIIAGRFRGTRLSAVGKGDAGAHLRPTSDRVRESLFSVLTHLDVIEDARVLDLFAGTGALGLEALSRGAQSVCMVENGRVAQRLIHDNIAKLRAEADVSLLRQDATRIGPAVLGPHDLVFLDPPYGKDFGARALGAALSGGWLAPEATVVWEEGDAMPAPDGFEVTDRRRYGETHVTVLRLLAGWIRSRQ